MLVNAGRRITTARLRGPSESLIHRGAVLLEEALRTASLPEADQRRLLFIRVLSLGVVQVDQSAGVMARQLERQVAELARDAVHGDDPRAASAQAVYFIDRLDALIVLVQQLARPVSGDRGQAWYWSRAVPGWRPDVTPAQTGRILLRAWLGLEGGIQSLAAAFQRLVEAGGADVILSSIQAEDGPALLRRWGWQNLSRGIASPSVDRSANPALPFPRAWHPMLRHWVTRWGASDDRSLWLLALAVYSWRSEAVPPDAVGGLVQAAAGAIAGFSDAVRPGPAWGTTTPRIHVEGHDRAAAGEEAVFVEDARPRACLPACTTHAGWWCVIQLLIRAGFGRAIQDHPEWVDAQVPWRLLRSCARRLAIPPEDPVWLWLAEHMSSEDGDSGRQERDPIVAHWRMAMRRWCRLQAHLGLVDLTRRQGRVSWTATHVDVGMPLSAVDLRVRRAGLDLDPGWVPWLGQVVRVHYEDEGTPYELRGRDGH